MIDKLFEEILLARLVTDASGCVLPRDEGFGSDPSIPSLCSRLARRTHKYIFLGAAKAFDIVWFYGSLYSLTIRFLKVERGGEYGHDFEAKFDRTMLD
jgi:hypothetical protein